MGRGTVRSCDKRNGGVWGERPYQDLRVTWSSSVGRRTAKAREASLRHTMSMVMAIRRCAGSRGAASAHDAFAPFLLPDRSRRSPATEQPSTSATNTPC
eukprot:2862558-Prymnesium_polylepis.1